MGRKLNIAESEFVKEWGMTNQKRGYLVAMISAMIAAAHMLRKFFNTMESDCNIASSYCGYVLR